MEPIRILHVLGIMNVGGAESRIMDLYRNIDRAKVQFDFLVHSTEEGYFDKEIKELGGNIFCVPRFKVYNYGTYKKVLKIFFAEHHEFKAVHGHMTSTASIYLPIAKQAGIPVSIAHARSAGVDKGLKGTITKWIRAPLMHRADYLFACSKEAAIAVYGEAAVAKGKVKIIPNAIDATKYVYDVKMRDKMREELGIPNKYVIGHVGRFHYAKNHEFLLQIFHALVRLIPNAVLVLIGEGELMEDVKEQAKELGILDKIIFTGRRMNISDYYQAMDYVVFPSRYEGLPGTVVEAQAAGLKCLVSDAVTPEVRILPLVKFYSLNKSPIEWAEQVMLSKNYKREDTLEAVKEAGFDVTRQVLDYQKFYLEECRNTK